MRVPIGMTIGNSLAAVALCRWATTGNYRVPRLALPGTSQAGGGGGVSAKCEVMGFCLKLATSKKGGVLPLLGANKISQNAPRGVTLDVHKCVFIHFWGMQKEVWGCFASKVTELARLVDAAVSHIKCGKDAMASGVGIQQRRPPLYLLTNVMVVVAAQIPWGGGGWTISLRRGPTPKRVPHRVPNPARRTFRHVSRFRSPLHGVPYPTMRSFRVVSRGAQSRNLSCANNKYICNAMVVCYCVSHRNARNRLTHALRTRKKKP